MRIARLTSFLAALLFAVVGLGQPALAEAVASEVECCFVAEERHEWSRTGQEHHVISRRVAAALEDHPTLAGQYTPRVTRGS